MAKAPKRPIIGPQVEARWRQLVADWRSAQKQLSNVMEDAPVTLKAKAQRMVDTLYKEMKAFRKKHGWDDK
jgi:hypothetical protein